MTEISRYMGYDVLAKRDTPSWDATTREVVDRRLQVPRVPRFLTPAEWRSAEALCRRIIPDLGPEAVPLVALLDTKLLEDHGSGFREADMPYMREAWRIALKALDAETRVRHGDRDFADLTPQKQDDLLKCMQEGRLALAAWDGMEAKNFFERRILVDIPPLYYGQPAAWNELGFGGPASPRGYVRLEGGRLDPWEATETVPGSESIALRANRHVY